MLLFKGAIKMGKCHDNYVQKFLTKHTICLLSLDRAMRRKEQVVTADMIREVTGNWWER